MPMYQDVVAATLDTVEKMLTARKVPGTVRVDTLGGSTASMEKNGATMFLHMPSMEPGEMLSRAQADRMVGYIVHEISHQLHTHWPTWLAACNEGATVKNLTNALEDLRIERIEAGGPWAGYGAAMTTLINHMDDEATAAAAKTGRVIGATASDLPWLVALIGRAECNGLNVPGAKRLRATVAPQLVPILDHAMRWANANTSTAECHKLARDLVAMVKQAQADASQPPQDAAQPDQGASDDAQGADDASPAQGAAPGNQAQGSSKRPAPSKGTKPGQGAGQPDPFTLDDKAAPSPALSADATPKSAKISPLAGTLSGDVRFHVEPSQWDGARPARVDHLRNALPRSALLMDQIGQLVASEEVRSHERRLTAGRFDRRGMSRAAMGSRDVYARKHATPGVHTAVLLLLDLSGSMQGEKLDAAKTMALHLAEAVDLAGAKCAVVGFATPRGHLNAHSGCRLLVLKGWDQTTRAAAPSICGVDAPFSTPLSPSIIASARWMRETVEADRYVLGALTDGECDYGKAGVGMALRTASQLGVDVFGLGCLHDISDAFRGFAHANVKGLADLPRAAMRQLLAQLGAAA